MLLLCQKCRGLGAGITLTRLWDSDCAEEGGGTSYMIAPLKAEILGKG